MNISLLVIVTLFSQLVFANPKVESIKNMDERYPVEFNLLIGFIAIAFSFYDHRKKGASEFQLVKAKIIGLIGVFLVLMGLGNL